jgi:hypothetical protein
LALRRCVEGGDGPREAAAATLETEERLGQLRDPLSRIAAVSVPLREKTMAATPAE